MKFEIRLFMILVLSLVSVDARKSRRKHSHQASSRTRGKSINDVIENVCLPKRTDRLVYRFKNDTHIYIGFDSLEDCTVYSMTWEIHEGNPDVLKRREHNGYDLEEASEVRKHPKQYIFAAARPGQQKLFKELIEDCSFSITGIVCLMEVFAKTAIKMKRVDFSGKCERQWPKQCTRVKI